MLVVRLFFRLNESLKRTTTVYMVMVATLIGVLGGLGAVGFRYLIQFLQSLAWLTQDYQLDWIASLPWYHVVLVPAAGGFLVGSIVSLFAREAKGHGVPEVMEAVALRSGRIRPRVVAAKALASSLCIASGGSVGREGPIVQIGSAIGSTVGQWLRVSPRRLRTLVGCGAAAGVAATFNAPVAGALFAVEVILGDFGVPQFSPIVISSVVATVISRHYMGDLPAFEIPAYSMEHPMELLAYAGLGVLAGLVAIVFIRGLHGAEDLFDAVKLPLAFKAAVGGMLVGAIALLFPGILGVGYEEMNRALLEEPAAKFLLFLLLAKLLAVSITIGSGGSGGIFAPSLFLGAVLGGAVGWAMQRWFPGSVGEQGAYALVGMGAVVASTTHAPITAIVILFELTNDYRIILPLMISCIAGTLLASRLHPESIYTIKLLRRGVKLRSGQDVNLLKRIPLAEILRRDVPTIASNVRLGQLLEPLLNQEIPCLYVVDEKGVLHGTITLQQLRPLLRDLESVKDLLIAEDVSQTQWPAVMEDQSLDHILQRLDYEYRDELPVVDLQGKLVGLVRLEDVLARYRKELFKHEMAGSIAGSLQHHDGPGIMHAVGDYVVAEVDAPAEFFGRDLASLQVRARFGLNVLLLKTADERSGNVAARMADPDSVVKADDRLVVFGPRGRVQAWPRG
ncbi:MAG: CBS domain-containing protein [Planctomycetota bacterium]|nr:MAG: CBS domain-containing protein [Planctomycetota bacterium]